MIALNLLCTMTVRLKEPLDAGNTPTGQRVIAENAGAVATPSGRGGGGRGSAHPAPGRRLVIGGLRIGV